MSIVFTEITFHLKIFRIISLTSVSYILPSFHNFSVITNSDSVNLFEFSEYPKVSFICFIQFGFFELLMLSH